MFYSPKSRAEGHFNIVKQKQCLDSEINYLETKILLWLHYTKDRLSNGPGLFMAGLRGGVQVRKGCHLEKHRIYRYVFSSVVQM